MYSGSHLLLISATINVLLLALCGFFYVSRLTDINAAPFCPPPISAARRLRSTNHSHDASHNFKSVLDFPSVRPLSVGDDVNLYSHMFWEIAPGSKKRDGRWTLDFPPGPHRVIIDVGLNIVSPYVCLMKHGILHFICVISIGLSSRICVQIRHLLFSGLKRIHLHLGELFIIPGGFFVLTILCGLITKFSLSGCPTKLK
jgi:hypothetical protein